MFYGVWVAVRGLWSEYCCLWKVLKYGVWCLGSIKVKVFMGHKGHDVYSVNG